MESSDTSLTLARELEDNGDKIFVQKFDDEFSGIRLCDLMRI